MKRADVIPILNENRSDLAETYGVKSLALSGSVSRDDATVSSAVDLLVEFDRRVSLFDFLALQEHLQTLLKVEKVDLVMRDSVFPELREVILGEAVDVG
jgi:hypothetical protein